MINTTGKKELTPAIENDMNENNDSTKKPDFSFFDEPVNSSQESQESLENDFSFLDEPLQTKETVVSEKPSNEDFSFDDLQTESGNKNLSSEESVKKAASFEQPTRQKMLFTCLKCNSKEEIDLPEQQGAEFKTTCSSCSSVIKITIESNSKRATQKSTEIYCCNCGSALLHTAHCPVCGIFCPDYYMVEDPAEAQRKARAARTNNFKQSIENLKSSLTWQRKEATTYTSSAAKGRSAKTGNLSAFLQNNIRLLAVACVLLLSISTVVFLYSKKQMEQQFVTNYIKATYAINVASEAILASMNKTNNDWKNAVVNGSSYTPKSDLDLELRTARITSELSKIMQKLQNKVPSKFENQYAKLQSLENEYEQLQRASKTMQPSLDKQTTVTKTFEQNIKKKKHDLKAVLNEELLNELEIAKKKYRGFDGF